MGNEERKGYVISAGGVCSSQEKTSYIINNSSQIIEEGKREVRGNDW